MTVQPKLFAVIPAAGHSRRMGQPKLMLPLGSKTVIARLLDALNHCSLTESVVVVRKDDEPLTNEVAAGQATALHPPVNPPDMRTSVEFAIREIETRYRPSDSDGWLLVPADHPVLDETVIDVLIEHWQQDSDQILIPTFNGKRGHPTFLKWSFAREVEDIPSDCGLNWLIREHDSDVTEIPVSNAAVITDIDRPEDYERLVSQWRS